MSEAQTTTDHDTIREWAEARDGNPARVEEFFKIFDENKLAFLYQDKTADGETSRFCKFVERD